MSKDASRLFEYAQIALGSKEIIRWQCHTHLEKYWGEGTDGKPYEVMDIDDNLLMNGGASCLWQSLIGNGVGTAGNNLAFFNNANAALGVGDSATAEVATTNDLVAASNKLRKAMDATYPLHTDGTAAGNRDIIFRSTFATTDANWAWAEWATFNSATAATGRMLQRKVQALGTKTSAATWQLTVTLSLA